MTAVQYPSHLNVRQYSPPPLRNAASQIAQPRHRVPLSNPRFTGASALGPDAGCEVAVSGGHGAGKNTCLPPNHQSPVANEVWKGASHGSTDASNAIQDVDENEANPRSLVVRGTKSNHDSSIASAETREISLAHGDPASSDDPKDWAKDWGPRHGFEEHYESEYLAQLNNVDPVLSMPFDWAFEETLPSEDEEPSRSRAATKYIPLLTDCIEHTVYQKMYALAIKRELHGQCHASKAHGDEANPFHARQNWYSYFTGKRHKTTANPKVPDYELQDWRMKDRLKTVSAALAICLNIGVEPPDQLKTNPGAILEAWQDPTVVPAAKALEAIGKFLQAQYETLAIRTRYKQYLDPSVEETKKFCVSLRRSAKDERVLFHYNGHGVPKPTASGEIWVFNKNYTQYIPISLYDLQSWLQAPTFFVWDCSDAGNILNNFHRFVDKHEQEELEAHDKDPNYTMASFRPYIHLAACGVKENLPTSPRLPADLFTCCLTSPIEMALWFFVLQNPLHSDLTPERAKKLPGKLSERRTPIGELNWIFTAITDTIAWTTLPRPLFRKFFRQDLMVAALFRNFLLAQRVMMAYGCHPQSWPSLPNTQQHPLWDSWDLAVEMALAQLPMLEKKEKGLAPHFEYRNSTFFTEQLTAFEVYLSHGAITREPPEQLPVVLQVLLSQQHRVRALILLGRFLDMGPWAVNLALSIGIFPYVLKLLQSAAAELKPVMVFIWTRVLAVDLTCQQDLLKDSGYNYFASILKPAEGLLLVNDFEHKAMCAFILAMLCNGYKQGQSVCNQADIMKSCLEHINNAENHLLRQWACLCISQLWSDLPEAKWKGIREGAYSKLCTLYRDPVPEVRAAMIYAMTTFLGLPDITSEVERVEEIISYNVIDMANDGSPIVRKELIIYLSKFVHRYEHKFIVTAFEHLEEEKKYLKSPPPNDGQEKKMGLHYAAPADRNMDGTIKEEAYGLAHNTIYALIWKHVFIMSSDPHPEVQRDAGIVIDYIHAALLHSPAGKLAQDIVSEIRELSHIPSKAAPPTSNTRPATPLPPHDDAHQLGPNPSLLKRTASFILTSLPFSATPDGAPTGSASSSLQRSPQRSGTVKRPRVPPDWQSPTESGDSSYQAMPGHAVKEPVSAHFEPRNFADPPALPLKSTFMEWAIEYFREPQMAAGEADEPGSVDYNKRLFRISRNERIMRETQPLKEHARVGKWNQPMGTLNNHRQPKRMAFHQFEDHLAIADERDTVSIWDWRTRKRLSRFSNGNPEGSSISGLKFINEDDQALLLSGSSDGVLRIYRRYEQEARVELAAAWRALTDLVPSNVHAGMVFDWQQVSGRVLVAGDVKVIRVWSAAAEYCSVDINARSGSCITSLTSDQMTGHTFVAGFGDGAVRVFDLRNPTGTEMVKRWKDEADRDWVDTVHMQRGGRRELFSSSRNGKVKLWDIRLDAPLKTIATTKERLRTTSVHEHLPVFAVGTERHLVKIFNLNGTRLSNIEPVSSSGFLNQRSTTAIAATCFHPHRMMLAAAAKGDTNASLFGCQPEVKPA